VKAGPSTRFGDSSQGKRLGGKALHLNPPQFISDASLRVLCEFSVLSVTKISFLYFFLLARPLLAQQQPSTEPPATIDIAFHVMQVGRASVPAIRHATGPGASAEVALKSHQRTGPYRYRGPNPLVFFRETPGADGRPVRAPVGTLRFAKEIKQALVFAIPRAASAATGDELTFVAIDDSRGSFGPDTLVIYNALPMRVGAVLGTRRFVVEPGASPPLSVKELGRGIVPMEFWIETSEGSKLVLGGEIDFTADNREVMILLPPRRAGSWIIQSVRISESMNTPPTPTATRGAGR
jgi:hypothetical protein